MGSYVNQQLLGPETVKTCMVNGMHQPQIPTFSHSHILKFYFTLSFCPILIPSKLKLFMVIRSFIVMPYFLDMPNAVSPAYYEYDTLWRRRLELLR
jgi:hypothetical protein